MPLGISVYAMKGKARSQKLAFCLVQGARAVNYRVALRSNTDYRGRPLDDLAAFYGYQGNMPDIMRDYVGRGRQVVFVDLGYWGRRDGGRWAGYHKVTVNARHPNEYLMRTPKPGDRFKRFGLQIRDWQPESEGQHILVAGMSEKSAESCGFGPYEWERKTIAELRKRTNRRIIYRPKPPGKRNPDNPQPIDGAEMRWDLPLERELHKCHAVVTHHSNVAIDAQIAGVPTFCWEGGGVHVSLQNLDLIEKLRRPSNREQWLWNLAYCQWSAAEIKCGAMFRHLQSEGLIP